MRSPGEGGSRGGDRASTLGDLECCSPTGQLVIVLSRSQKFGARRNPWAASRGLLGVDMASPRSEPDLEAFYAGVYTRLVATVGAVAGDRHEGEEAVQEAFIRLIGRWEQVSRYEDPEAWMRKVALGYVSNRRRKARNGVRAVLRLGRPATAPGPDPDAVDVQRALRLLPQAQRMVVVLHYYMGLDGPQIARELDIPIGTVKARLSRARQALLPLLREDIHDHA